MRRRLPGILVGTAHWCGRRRLGAARAAAAGAGQRCGQCERDRHTRQRPGHDERRGLEGRGRQYAFGQHRQHSVRQHRPSWRSSLLASAIKSPGRAVRPSRSLPQPQPPPQAPGYGSLARNGGSTSRRHGASRWCNRAAPYAVIHREACRMDSRGDRRSCYASADTAAMSALM